MDFLTNLEELNFIIFHNLSIKDLITLASVNKYLKELLIDQKYWHYKFIYYNKKIINEYIPKNMYDWDKCFKYSTFFYDIIKLRNKDVEWKEEFEWIDNCVNEANDIMIVASIKNKRVGWVNSSFTKDDKYSCIKIEIKDFSRLIYLTTGQFKCSNKYRSITFQFDNNSNFIITFTKHERIKNVSNKPYAKEEFLFIIATIIYDENYKSITDIDGFSFEEEKLDPDVNEECERIGMYKLLKHLKTNKLLKL